MNKKYLNFYTRFLGNFFKIQKPLKVVFDCSNGTTGLVLKELLRIMGHKLRAELINAKPDGNFPAHGPNPLLKGVIEQLEKEVKKHKADLGVIFDADGDRVFFVDDQGRSIGADEIGYILMKELEPARFVVSIVSGWLLKKQKGAALSRVGHYFFKKMMRGQKIPLGLEHSGHYYFKDFFYCESGILAAIKVINFISRLNIKLSSYLDSLPKYYRSGEINFKVKDKEGIIKIVEKKYKNQTSKILKLDGLTMEFNSPAGGWWFSLRPSNTENLLRLNLEATNKKTLQKVLRDLKKLI